MGIFFSYVAISQSFQQQEVIVKLRKSKGAYPYTIREYIGQRYKTNDSIPGIPEFLLDFRTYKIPLLATQYSYEKYLNGTAERTDSFRLKSIDEKYLTKKQFDYFLYAVCGLYEGKKIIILDVNNNNDVSDDPILSFKYDRNEVLGANEADVRFEVNHKTKMDNYESNELEVKYEVYDGKKVVDRNMLIEVQPYYNVVPNPNTVGSYEWFDYSFLMLLAEHRVGECTVQGKDYEIFIMQCTPRFLFNGIAFYAREKGKKIAYPLSLKEVTFYPVNGNNILIGNQLYDVKVDYVNGMSATLISKKEKLDSSKNISNGLFSEVRAVDFTTGKKIRIPPPDRDSINLINFWGSWCGPCKDDFPKLVTLYEKYSNKVHMTGIAVEKEKDEDNLKRILQNYKITWPQVCDEKSLNGEFGVSNKIGVHVFPTYLLIKEGAIYLRTSSIEELEKTLGKL